MVAGAYYGYAQLASACDNYYYHDTPTGYTSLHLTYQESSNTYTVRRQEYTQSGLPDGPASTNDDISEYSMGKILEKILGPGSDWYEEL